VGPDGNEEVETFDGQAWSAPTVIPGLWPAYNIRSLSCASASFCVATGSSESYPQPGYDTETSAATFDGSAWTQGSPIDSQAVVQVQCPAASFFGFGFDPPDSLSSCPTASFCMVIGFGGDTATFNGASWSAPARIPR